jgi:hypothetical protein
VRVELPPLFIARPASPTSSANHPDLIPTREVLEMAPPINPFAIMGKKSKASLGKGKGKGKSKEGSPKKRQRRAIFEVIALKQATSNADSRSAVPDPSVQIPHIIHVDESEQVDKPGPRRSRRLAESEVA